MRTTLTKLCCMGGTIVDSAFISSSCIFCRLTHVFVDGSCSREGGCTFLLTNDDVTKPCRCTPRHKTPPTQSSLCRQSMPPTALSPFVLSTRCPKLKSLEIHFNTANIIHDLDRLYNEPQYQRMRSLLRCPLRYLAVVDAPISLHNVHEVAIRVFAIFHGLQGFRGRRRRWIDTSRCRVVRVLVGGS